MIGGIGPKDQLTVVQNSADGKTMIEESQWIELPVGKNLIDHTNTDLVFTHPDVVFYDFYEAWDSPIQTDAQSYLSRFYHQMSSQSSLTCADNRAGILAQSAPNIGPM